MKVVILAGGLGKQAAIRHPKIFADFLLSSK